MVKLDFFKDLMKKREREKNEPMHVAFTTYGTTKWAAKNKVSKEDAYIKKLNNIIDIINVQIEKNIPLLTINLLSKETILENADVLSEFLIKLKNSDLINKNKIRVNVLGKWYDLPAEAVTPIKEIIEETKDYDNFFLNFCINYDGQEEIVNASKLIARKVKEDKMQIEDITKKEFKDNIYNSYFLKPDLIIDNSGRISGLLLWDSKDSVFLKLNKLFQDFSKKDFLKILESYKEGKL
jgi:undecaprenyl diphosphate synthase